MSELRHRVKQWSANKIECICGFIGKTLEEFGAHENFGYHNHGRFVAGALRRGALTRQEIFNLAKNMEKKI